MIDGFCCPQFVYVHVHRTTVPRGKTQDERIGRLAAQRGYGCSRRGIARADGVPHKAPPQRGGKRGKAQRQ